MAQLNTFKSLQHTFRTEGDTSVTEPHLIYTAPEGYTAIILNAQAANVKSSPAAEVTVTLQLHKGPTASEQTTLVKQLIIPISDAANLATGKLVLQAGDKLVGFVDNNDGNNALDLTLSFLETLDA